jgi:hypothetical protein
VKLPLLASFRGEAARYALRFTCPHCAYFDPEREMCAHGYPTDEHRREDADPVVFCKEMELA